MKKVLVVGNSDLGSAFKHLCDKEHPADNNITVVGRPEYDLVKQEDCDRLVKEHNADCIIITHGYLGDDSWNTLMTNFVSPAYLVTQFYKEMPKGQIIVVSSASTQWVSYPGIKLAKMMYGVTKEAISNFTRHFVKKMYDQPNENVYIQCFEPASFRTKFNDYASYTTPETVARDLKQLVDNQSLSNVLSLNT